MIRRSGSGLCWGATRRGIAGGNSLEADSIEEAKAASLEMIARPRDKWAVLPRSSVKNGTGAPFTRSGEVRGYVLRPPRYHSHDFLIRTVVQVAVGASARPLCLLCVSVAVTL
jgi:hypothetical protein